MIYLDNAATTNYKPKQVIDTVIDCLTKHPFNANRGASKYSLALNERLQQTRNKLHLLFNNDSQRNVVFTSGCTQALNLAILGLARRGHVIISSCEHNSVIRPLMQLQKRGYVTISVAKPNEQGQVTTEEIQRLLTPTTYLVCVSHASNVTGQLQNLQQTGKLLHSKKITFLVDCAQSVGYVPLDMAKNYVNVVAIPAHKGLHAMQGAGALIFDDDSKPCPITFGGTGTESNLLTQPTTLPESLESGTLPTPALLAMSAGVDWWLANWQQNDQTVRNMQRLLLDGLRQIKGVTTYGDYNKSGIVAFNVGKWDSNYVADLLSEKYDVAVRGGLQCAPLMHEYLKTTNQGVVRASVSCVTTKQDCFALLNAVNAIAKGRLT